MADDDASTKQPPAPPVDVMLVHSATEDGKGARVLRVHGDEVEAGEVRPLEEGKAIAGEVVKPRPRSENGRVCDVEVVVPKPKSAAPSARATSHGPAQIATEDYRDNWSRIFGSSSSGRSSAAN